MRVTAPPRENEPLPFLGNLPKKNKKPTNPFLPVASYKNLKFAAFRRNGGNIYIPS